MSYTKDNQSQLEVQSPKMDVELEIEEDASSTIRKQVVISREEDMTKDE
jgi:hypothetical protein